MIQKWGRFVCRAIIPEQECNLFHRSMKKKETKKCLFKLKAFDITMSTYIS